MTSTLARQLQKLQAPQTSLLDDTKKTASILFEPSEARNYNREVFINIGQAGLRELIDVNEAFRPFAHSLFGKNAVNYQRAVQSQEENVRLNLDLENFLLLLSPYLQKQAALKALEWLVHRYMVHKMNVSTLMMIVFPYYETTLFVRVLQVLSLDHGKNKEWQWLLGYQKQGRPVPKLTVFIHWCQSQSFRHSVADYLEKMIKVHKTSTNVQIAVSFYVATVLGGLQAIEKVTEDHMMYIVKNIQLGVRSEHEELNLGTYLIIAVLSVKVQFSTQFVTRILTKILKNVNKCLREQCLLCLLTIAHHQECQPFGRKVLDLLQKATLLHLVQGISKTKSVAAFVCAYVAGYVGFLFSNVGKGRLKKLMELVDWIGDLHLSVVDGTRIIRCLVDSLLQQHESAKKEICVASLVARLEKNHPVAFDNSISVMLTSKLEKYLEVINDMVTKEDSHRNVLLQLSHSDASVRVAACDSFLRAFKMGKMTSDKTTTNNILKTLASDDDPEIVARVLALGKARSSLCSAVLVPLCEQGLAHARASVGNWGDHVGMFLSVLSGKLTGISTEQRTRVSFLCLQHLLSPCGKPGLHAAGNVLRSSHLTLVEPLFIALKNGMRQSSGEFPTSQKHFRKAILKVLPECVSSEKVAQSELWCQVMKGAGLSLSDQHLHGVWLTLLWAGVQAKAKNPERTLQLAHILTDACLEALQDQTVPLIPNKVKNENMKMSVLVNAAILGNITITFLADCLNQATSHCHLPASLNVTGFWSLTHEWTGVAGVKKDRAVAPLVKDDRLLLLVKIFRTSVQMQIHDMERKQLGVALFQKLFKECLDCAKMQMYFLSMIWSWESCLPYSEIIDHSLQIWCLNLGTNLLIKWTSSLVWAIRMDQPLVPGLLCALSSAEKTVRRGALMCLQALSKVTGSRLVTGGYWDLVEGLVDFSQEITTDVNQLPIAISKLSKKCRVDKLVKVVLMPEVAMHVKDSILFALSEISNESLLMNLLPLASRILDQIYSLHTSDTLDQSTSRVLQHVLLRFSPDTARSLKEAHVWNVFLRALNCARNVLPSSDGGKTSPQGILMDQVICQEFFVSIGRADMQARLWLLLIGRVVDSDHKTDTPAVVDQVVEVNQLRKGIRKISLDASIIANEIGKLPLGSLLTSEKKSVANINKKIRVAKDKQGEQMRAWKMLHLMLETMALMKCLARPWLLVRPLFECLALAHVSQLVISEHVQLLLLCSLSQVLQMSLDHWGPKTRENIKIDVGVIVRCLLDSKNPDVMERALPLLSLAAGIVPEQLLGDPMVRIFTYIGKEAFRRENKHSFEIVLRTIAAIVPELVKSESSDESALVCKLVSVLSLFVGNVEKVPTHRRLPLFEQLVKTVDPAKNLWVFMVLMIKMYPLRNFEALGVKEEERPVGKRTLDGDMKVWENSSRGDDGPTHLPADVTLELCSQLAIEDQLNGINRVMQYLIELPERLNVNETFRVANQTHAAIIKWTPNQGKQLWQFKLDSVNFIQRLFASTYFIDQVLASAEDVQQSTSVQNLIGELVQKTMCYEQKVNKILQKKLSSDKPDTEVQFWKELERRVLKCCDLVTALLPPTMFLNVVMGLLLSEVATVRVNVMILLIGKLKLKDYFNSEHSAELLVIVHRIVPVAANVKEPTENRQAVLALLQHNTKWLAQYQVEPQELVPVMDLAVQLVCDKSCGLKILLQAFLVLAEIVRIVKAEFVRHLKNVMPVMLKVLELHEVEIGALLAVVIAIHEVVKSTGAFLSPYLPQLLCSTCILSAKHITCSTGTDKATDARLHARLTGIGEALVVQIEPRVLIPAFKQAYGILSDKEFLAVGTLMNLVENFVVGIRPHYLVEWKNQLCELFQEAMDLRLLKGDSKEVSHVEGNVIESLVKLLLRLNERNNAEIFNSFQQWATTTGEGKPARLITFYRFADRLADSLKVLFLKAKLADRLFPHAVKILTTNNTLHSKTMVFGTGTSAKKQTCLLVGHVLDTLGKIFTYDSVNFNNEYRFQALVMPLVDQLENMADDNNAYEVHVSSHLIPCLVKFTSATSDDSLWRELNRQVLMRVRMEDQPRIIVAALKTFRALLVALGQDFLQPLLADTIPYITEVLESVDSEVEVTAKEIYLQMEDILGESLAIYLDN